MLKAVKCIFFRSVAGDALQDQHRNKDNAEESQIQTEFVAKGMYMVQAC